MHYHHGILAMFFLGQLVQAWQRAAEAVGSKYNGISSLDQYFKLRAQEISGRLLLVSCLFGGWASGDLAAIVSTFSPATGAAIAAHPFPPFWWAGGLVGYFGDSGLYFLIGLVGKFVPGIRSDVPPPVVPDPTPPSGQSKS